jgi:predicted metal-dependent HD superfamily phosphohydrolase
MAAELKSRSATTPRRSTAKSERRNAASPRKDKAAEPNPKSKAERPTAAEQKGSVESAEANARPVSNGAAGEAQNASSEEKQLSAPLPQKQSRLAAGPRWPRPPEAEPAIAPPQMFGVPPSPRAVQSDVRDGVHSASTVAGARSETSPARAYGLMAASVPTVGMAPTASFATPRLPTGAELAQTFNEWTQPLAESFQNLWGGAKPSSESLTGSKHPTAPPVAPSNGSRGPEDGTGTAGTQLDVEVSLKLVNPIRGRGKKIKLDRWKSFTSRAALDKYLKSFGPEYGALEIKQSLKDPAGNFISQQVTKFVDSYLESLPETFDLNYGISNPVSYSPVTEPNVQPGDFMKISQILARDGVLGSFGLRFSNEKASFTIGPTKLGWYLQGRQPLLHSKLKSKGVLNSRVNIVTYEAFANNIKQSVIGAKSMRIDEFFRAIGEDMSKWDSKGSTYVPEQGGFLPPRKIHDLYTLYDELFPKPHNVLPEWTKKRILIGRVYSNIRQLGHRLVTFPDTQQMVSLMLNFNESNPETPLTVAQAFDAFLRSGANKDESLTPAQKFGQSAALILGAPIDTKIAPSDKLSTVSHSHEENLLFLRTRWKALMDRLRVPDSLMEGQYQFLEEHYSEAQRAYHTLSHVRRMLELMDTLRDYREFKGKVDWDALEWAIIFHDVVYNIGAKSSENEKKSLKASRIAARLARLPHEFIQKTSEYIMATAQTSPPQSLGAKLMSDLDLSSFAVPSSYYFRYGQQVLDEDTHVIPEKEHLRKLLGFMNLLTGRPRIFFTNYFFDRYEDQARANIEKSKFLHGRALETAPNAAWDAKAIHAALDHFPNTWDKLSPINNIRDFLEEMGPTSVS